MLVKRRRARLLEIAQDNDADAELRKLRNVVRGGAPRGRLDSRPGQRCMRYPHMCLSWLLRTRLGNAALIPAGIELRPQFVEYVGMRPSNPPGNVASFKNVESVATAPQLRAAAWDGALRASAARKSVLYLKMFGLRRWRLLTGWVLLP
jgi:hypothetical protein